MTGAIRVHFGFLLGSGLNGTGWLTIFHGFNHVTIDNVQPPAFAFLSLFLFNSLLFVSSIRYNCLDQFTVGYICHLIDLLTIKFLTVFSLFIYFRLLFLFVIYINFKA